MTLFLFAVLICIAMAGTEFYGIAIKDQNESDKDTSRQAWWPDPDNKDKGNRKNERPYIH